MKKLTLNQKLKKTMALGLSSLLLVACGGGGGGASQSLTETTSSSEQTTSFAPNSERLLEEATNSKELYVEEDFRFDHTQLTRLNIQLSDADGSAIPFARLNVYVVDTSEMEELPEEWSDDLLPHSQLITGGLSNQDGNFVRIIELPKQQQTASLLLIEANTVGNQNKRLVLVEGENTQVNLGAI